jgi:hypothetical protein
MEHSQLVWLPQKEEHVVLAINAANGPVDWDYVESFAEDDEWWRVESLVLEGFGELMACQGFQAALDHFDALLQNAIEDVRPDVLLVSSKGVGIVTHLAVQGLWNGPSILISPIPNPSNHVMGGSWESEWQSTVQILVDYGVGPVIIAVGSTLDEKTLITEAIEETKTCGKLSNGAFEDCPNWYHQVIQGGHDWKSNPSNARFIAGMITKIHELTGGEVCIG